MMLEYLIPVVLLFMLIAASIRILPEYKRGVIFFLGRFQSVKGHLTPWHATCGRLDGPI